MSARSASGTTSDILAAMLREGDDDEMDAVLDFCERYRAIILERHSLITSEARLLVLERELLEEIWDYRRPRRDLRKRVP